jgi:hypothetical protein
MHVFRAAVESGEFDTIGNLCAEDVILHSPAIICAVANTLNDFHCDKELSGEHGGDHASMFNASVDGLQIQGCDFVQARADGLIDTITSCSVRSQR